MQSRIEYSFQETNGMLGLQKMETSIFDDSYLYEVRPMKDFYIIKEKTIG